ncbi:MAG: hypothetical protein SOZ56_06735 [Oscillospiraceae bacterium]|nr:hypothetical protein [Oscillospiraceae bacterium]
MACFIVPGAEAIIAAAASKIIAVSEEKGHIHSEETATKLSEKVSWLAKLSGGGSALLAFEHLWHGEISPFFPFLTAASDPEETSIMLHEMATVGTSMSLLITAVWIGMLVITASVKKKAAKETNAK